MSKINTDLIDELLKDYQKPEDITGDNGLLKQLTKAILERALESEMTHELGYKKHSRPAKPSRPGPDHPPSLPGDCSAPDDWC